MDDPEFARTVTFKVPIPDSSSIPPALYPLIAGAVGEAQLLEGALKSAVRLDTSAFAPEDDLSDLLKVLETATLGGVIKMAQGEANLNWKQKAISKVAGFAQLLPTVSGLTQLELADKLSDILRRRNAIIHHYLIDIVQGRVTEPEAAQYLSQSCDRFAEMKAFVIVADFHSSKMGGVDDDGSSLPRLPKC